MKCFHEMLSQAILLAVKAHGTQPYGKFPYLKHLSDVYEVLKRFNYTDESEQGQVLHVAAFLHDILEDTKVTRNEIEAMFGGEICALVYAVTNESGENRRERHAKTYPKILANADAIILKLADRIANMEQSLRDNTHLDMYVKEWDSFRFELKQSRDFIVLKMWKHLEVLITEAKCRIK